jgi:hypothetical protein
VLPLLYIYGRDKLQPAYQERAMDLMNLIPAEGNHVISGWEELNIGARSAHDSQALLELKNNYCNEKRCLECKIGARLLKDSLS